MGLVSSHLVQLPAETLKNVMFVDLEYRLALVEYSMHDNAERVHVRGGVTADGQYVLRGQVLRIGEAQRRKVGFPLFTCVLQLKAKREDTKIKDLIERHNFLKKRKRKEKKYLSI